MASHLTLDTSVKEAAWNGEKARPNWSSWPSTASSLPSQDKGHPTSS